MAENEPKNGVALHWPILIMGVAVAVIFFSILFVFQVHEVEYAIVERFGKPLLVRDGDEQAVKVFDPGLHFKIPFIDRVWSHDKRYQVYALKRGQVEEMQTSDDIQVIVTTFVNWRVGDVYRFYRRIETTENAEAKLDEIVRNSRSNIIGQHPLRDFINVDEDQLQISTIETEILENARQVAMEEYGIEIKYVGIKHLGFPQSVSQEVFRRMQTERETKAEEILSEADREASQIRTRADAEAARLLVDARSEATRIKGDGDKAAAEHYRGFRRNPELAVFLRKLDALRETLGDESTTLILDTNTIPYDLLLPGAIDLETLSEEMIIPEDTAPEKDKQ